MKREIQELGIRDWWGTNWIKIQDELYSALEEGLLKGLGNVILAGCGITANAGNWNIAAGIAYIDGRICRFAGANNVALPGYLKLQESSTAEEYSDGGIKTVETEYTAVFSVPVPGGGHVTIRSTGADRMIMAKLDSNNVLSGLPKSDSLTLPDTNTLATSKAVKLLNDVVTERGSAYFYAQNENQQYAPLQKPDFRQIAGNNLAGTLGLAAGRHFQMRYQTVYKVHVLKGDAINLELRTASSTFNLQSGINICIRDGSGAEWEDANFYWGGNAELEVVVEFLGYSEGY